MSARIRDYRPTDKAATYHVCLKTGDNGGDGESFYREDPDALGRIYVGPYLQFEPELALVLEDEQGVCGYALGAFDSREFWRRYEEEWRPRLCAEFQDPASRNPSRDAAEWTRVEHIWHQYHAPEYFLPEPYERYPSHCHIDLLDRGRGAGHGRAMMETIFERLRSRGSPGVHLEMSAVNDRAYGFYRHLGFVELARRGSGEDGSIFLGLEFRDASR